MAYRQPHDPYYNANAPYRNEYAPSQPQAGTGAGQYEQDWDSKSAKSYQSSYAGSQAHLQPSYEKQPPMPSVPYQGAPQYPQAQQYPPSPQRPGMYHAPSSAGWSVAREKLMKRRSVKQVQLIRGNLVLDVNVPTPIIPAGKTDEEFTKLRYTAATCDPDDFMASRYSLRQYLAGRHTELFIVMTMYNEDEVLFLRTMNSYVSHFTSLDTQT